MKVKKMVQLLYSIKSHLHQKIEQRISFKIVYQYNCILKTDIY